MTYKEAGQVAHGLIQGYIGPDHKVMDMASFYGALVQALQAAHQQVGRIETWRRPNLRIVERAIKVVARGAGRIVIEVGGE